MASAIQRRRAIINTDAKNEADDQYAIVHALLSPTIDVRGLIAAHFGRERSQRSMEDSREEIDLLLGLLGREGDVRVANGAPGGLERRVDPDRLRRRAVDHRREQARQRRVIPSTWRFSAR